MKNIPQQFLIWLLAVLMVWPWPLRLDAQGTGAGFKPGEIEQLVAPIALYPDSLVSQILMALALCALASCSTSKFKTYRGPNVTAVEVHKSDHRMYLLHGAKVLKAYDIHLGGNPVGPKQFEGDGKTPESCLPQAST